MDQMQFRETVVTAEACRSKESLHEHLKRTLQLPGYYGKNLSALADCLAESSTPTLITLRIEAEEIPAGMQAYVLRLAQVCARESLANDAVSLIIEHP